MNMGLPMDNIQATLVEAGSTSGLLDNGKRLDAMPLGKLTEERDVVEKELWALGSVLESVGLSFYRLVLWLVLTRRQHGVTMDTSLTTFDGYPRADIDIVQSTSELHTLTVDSSG